MSTLILSYPGPGLLSAGAAMGQWLELCDHITRAGGHILILDDLDASTVYAGRLGASFLTPGTLNRPIFLRAGDAGKPAAGEDPVAPAIAKAGLQVRHSTHRFQGQVDVIPIDRNRFVLTYTQDAPGSSRAGLEEVKALLPLGALALEIELRPPYTAGAQALVYLTAPSGSKMLLVHRAALLSHTPEDVAKFAGGHVEYFVLSPEDAAVHVSESLLVRGTLIMQPGSSTILRGQLARRGFQLVETDVSLLFGADGRKGGPRTLANDLPGLVLSEDAPSYANRREEMFERRATYK